MTRVAARRGVVKCGVFESAEMTIKDKKDSLRDFIASESASASSLAAFNNSSVLSKFAAPSTTSALASLAAFNQSSVLSKFAAPSTTSTLARFVASEHKLAHSAVPDFIRASREYETHFYNPRIAELAALSSQFEESAAFVRFSQIGGASELLRQAMTSMTTPWVNAQDALRSIASFADLYSINNLIGIANPFEDLVSKAWRERLGDWRDRVTHTTDVAENSELRSNFYVERGLDSRLTEFPPSAFDETLEVTGLRHEPPTLVKIYGPPVPPSESDEEESSFNRGNMAHDWLQRFETQLRRFIDDLMTREFGPNWPKHALPPNIYEDWRDKKAKAEQAGSGDRPMIAYADFTHYEIIICNRKNWKFFAAFFQRPESIRESLQRLYLPRIMTMHARPITQEDELLLYAEIKRLSRAFNR